MRPPPPRDIAETVFVRPHHWRFITQGTGPEVLFLHGAGASTHSWRGLIDALERDFRCIAIDLPGHGGTELGVRQRSSLELMAEDVLSLIRAQDWHPRLIVGHSAGAAIGLRLVQKMEAQPLVGINPALQPFEGLAGLTFPIVARAIAVMPWVVDTAARMMSDPRRVKSLLSGTGSKISSEYEIAYAELFTNKRHIEGVMLMMAQWKLDGLLADLPRIKAPCLFITGSNDRTVPPVVAVDSARRMAQAQTQSLDGYGHLIHEEAPDQVAALIRQFISQRDLMD